MQSEVDFLVGIQCITYNQSSYITDTLNGFAMQQTDFPFVAVIIDDASIDGEQEVIKSYIEEHFDHSERSGYKGWETGDACWIFARHKGNENCHFVAVLLKRNLYKEQEKKEAVIKNWMNTKYIALCEGDDYWIDPLKLQKQVDFLEDHPEYSLCCHGFRTYDGITNCWSEGYVNGFFVKYPKGFSFNRIDNLKAWMTKTLTMMYRKDYAGQIKWPNYKYKRDTHLCYHLLKMGNGYCLPIVGAVYRKTDQGIFSSLDYFQRCEIDFLICYEIARNNPEDLELQIIYEEEKLALFEMIRIRFRQHEIQKEVRRLVNIYSRAVYEDQGLKAVLFSFSKMIKSYIKGF